MAEMNGAYVLLTETDVSKQLRVSLAALRKWRVLNRGPQFVKMGPLVRYRQTDIDAWLGSLPVGGGACQEAFGTGHQALLRSGQPAGTANGRLKQSAAS